MSTLPPQQRFDPFRPEIHADPYPFYAELRKGDPVHWGMPFLASYDGAWYISRYDDVARLLKDSAMVKNQRSIYPEEKVPPIPEEMRFYSEMARHAILLNDPPDHTRLRKLVSQAFTPRVIANLQEPAESIASSLLDEAASRNHLDVLGDYAFPLTLRVISALIGVSEDYRELLWRWSRVLIRTLDLAPSREVFVEANRIAHEAFAFFEDVISAHRAHPTDDLLSHLLAAHDQEEGTLSEEELIVMCTLLLIAGFDTTVNLIGNGTLALLQHPDQLEILAHQPEMMPTAVEEMLRFEPSTQKALRYAGLDFELRGKQIHQGQALMLLLASANRDPEVFLSPDQFDVTRTDNRHLGFGAGIHVCLGAPLARLEGRVALTALLRRFPRLQLMTDKPEWREELGTFRRLSRLDVQVA